ncbi:MAG TPA: glutathione S-transferase [Azospirillaceae bacterium]|nr:glutathione S-transferase [Azospirillaceae bacterium]
MARLLGKRSSINVRKVLWTALEVGARLVQEDWGSGFRSTAEPEFLALNPHAMVPVLVDGDVVLWESNAICRYLAASHGRADLLPGAPAERARVEMWMDWQASDFNNAWRYAFSALVRHSPDHQDPALLAAGIAQWNRTIDTVAGQLARTGAYIAGDGFTLADVVIGLSVNRWLKTPFEKPVPPEIARYLERLSERPAFQEVASVV